MHAFETLLQRWDYTLRKYNPNFYQQLYPPLSAEEIESKLNALGCHDDNLKAWFGWKDGIDPKKDPDIECMIFYFGVMPLSLDATARLEKARAFGDKKEWGNSFIPVAMDSSGLFLLFNKDAGDNYGQIYLYSVSLLFTQPISYYDSIAAMIETAIVEYEQGVLVYDPEEDWLNEDNAAHYDIASSINTHTDYWKLKGTTY